MNNVASERIDPMRNPPHLCELIRERMDEASWNVTETTGRLGCERVTLLRLRKPKARGSANMALEGVGRGTAEHWMRMQTSYEIAQERRHRTAEQHADAEKSWALCTL